MSLISVFNSEINSLGFRPVMNKFESSAKNNEKNFSGTFTRSLIYNKNKSGPNREPCGTPHLMHLLNDLDWLYSTYCVRPER